jgi:hypothetical protein
MDSAPTTLPSKRSLEKANRCFTKAFEALFLSQSVGRPLGAFFGVSEKKSPAANNRRSRKSSLDQGPDAVVSIKQTITKGQVQRSLKSQEGSSR